MFKKIGAVQIFREASEYSAGASSMVRVDAPVQDGLPPVTVKGGLEVEDARATEPRQRRELSPLCSPELDGA